jgi:hypothetical protein
MIFDWGVQYTVGKIFLKVIKYFPCMIFFFLLKEDMNIQKFGIVRVPILGLPFGSLGKKCHLDIALTESH